jgi:serine/threonine protein kinase
MSTDAVADLLIGVVLDEKYRIDAPLGRGGMGTVYRAMHLGTGREVALKVLVPELTANEASIERFKREAKTAGQMRHPNVVDVTDFGFADLAGARLAYLVMELLQGKTLRALMETCGRVPLDVAIDVLDQVCAAVTEAHGMGVLHRDIKPENIHLGPGARGRYRVKVLDFGIAKLLHETVQEPPPAADAAMPAVVASAASVTMPEMAFGDAPTLPVSQGDGSLTRLGAVIGTPRYMSPEQWLGREIDLRADVYSLGVMAYEMLAGEPPFLGKVRSIAIEHAEFAPPPLTEKAPTVPAKIANVIERAMAKEPGGRPPTAAAFAAGLKVGAETTGKLLRRSIELCVDHYLLFSRRCALLTLPPIALAAVGLVSTVLAHAGLVTRRVDLVIGVGANLLGVVIALLAWGAIAGTIVPLVADLVTPGASPRSPPPAAELWRVARGALPSTLVAMGTIAAFLALIARPWIHALTGVLRLGRLVTELFIALVGTPVICIVGCAAIAPIAVYPAVVAVEGASGLAPLRRSAALLRSMWRAAFGVSALYALLTQVPPALIGLLFGHEDGSLVHTPAEAFGITAQVDFLCIWLATAVFQPFTLVAPAMLYLRAREAEGKPFT